MMKVKRSTSLSSTHCSPSIPSVRTYLGRQGSLFLRRGRDVKEIFSFTESTMTITQEQIMGRKPSAEAFKAYSSDQGTWEEGQELSWVDYVKLTTTREDYTIPRTLRRRDVARVLEENTLPPTLREVLNLLKLRGRPKRQMEVCAKPVQEENHTLDQEGVLFIGLAALLLEDIAAAVTTRAVLRSSQRNSRRTSSWGLSERR